MPNASVDKYPWWTLLPLVIVMLGLFLAFLTLVIALGKSHMDFRVNYKGVIQNPVDK